MIKTQTSFLTIETKESNDDLKSYGLENAKEGEYYALKVSKREKNLIEFNIIRIPRGDLEII